MAQQVCAMPSTLSIVNNPFVASCVQFVRRAIAPSCLLCNGPARGELICEGCDGDLPRLRNVSAQHCDQCAIPITEGNRCGACLAHTPAYDHVCAPFTYDFPTDALVQGLKYRGMLAVAPLLGKNIANSMDEQPDVLIPMPLGIARLRERGFNQAQEIARHIAQAHHTKLLPHACRRVRDTPPQAALPWKERAKNIRKAFVCDADFTGQHVGVVDDVMTTGATLNEIARNLKQAGATRVTGLIATRTLPGKYRKAAIDV